MANSVMRKYEGLFLIDSATAAANWDATIKIVETMMNRAGATVLSMKKWDDRRLCYPIKGHHRGTYILTYFEASPGAIAGIERDVQISEEMLRVMILNAERIPASVIDAPTPDQMAAEGERRQDGGGDPAGEADGAPN